MRLISSGLVFAEGPRWHDGALWLSDMDAHRILKLSPAGALSVVAELDDKPSGLGFLPDGSLLAVLMRSRRVVRIAGGQVMLHADLSSMPGTHLNDMVVDGQGRAYVASRNGDAGGQSHRPAGEGVVLVAPDGALRMVATDLWAPNGMAVSPDGRTLVVAETLGERLSAFDIAADGSLSRRRVFAKLGVRPDGICMDAEGAVWVGAVLAGEFLRVREGGEVVQRIAPGDGRWAVACVLGGPRRRTLYMASAHNSFANLHRLTSFEADLASTARSYVETVEVEVPGAGWP